MLSYMRGDSEIAVYALNPHLNLSDQRLQLPIYKSKNQILYLIEKFQAVVLVGQTGSGKTTQLPQYLMESG
jgi:ATP-dependent RNA helicase DDX35